MLVFANIAGPHTIAFNRIHILSIIHILKNIQYAFIRKIFIRFLIEFL